jgi:hypothetical protein
MMEMNDIGETFTEVALLRAKVKTKYWTIASTKALSSVNMKVINCVSKLGSHYLHYMNSNSVYTWIRVSISETFIGNGTLC